MPCKGTYAGTVTTPAGLRRLDEPLKSSFRVGAGDRCVFPRMRLRNSHLPAFSAFVGFRNLTPQAPKTIEMIDYFGFVLPWLHL
jgi:hypothetical protein